MKEDFLYYLWQYQQFDKTDLRTETGEPLAVLKTGVHNPDAGPDFSLAKLRIGEVEWAGSVEMHLRASDWNRHGHQHDEKYGNVTLHVVWENDAEVLRPDKTPMPTLALKNKAFPGALEAYNLLLREKPGIPCAPFYPQVPELTRLAMLDRCLHERLSAKMITVQEIAEAENHDWELVSYRWLFRAFGFKINSEAMFRLGAALPWHVVRKHADSLLQLEALLFGQAGLLPTEASDEHTERLKQEYNHLANKYGLLNSRLQASNWNFFRLRPANFPTIRLAQLAALLHKTPHLRQTLLETESVKEYHALLAVQQSEYWQQHYQPGKPAKSRVAGLGVASVHNLIINTVAPLLAAYSEYKGDLRYTEKAIHLLETVPAEHNHVTAIYEALGQKVKTASDSQALLQLNNQYCQPVRCLSCAISIKILKENTA